MNSAHFNCPLCAEKEGLEITTEFKRTFFRCIQCDLLSLKPSQRLSQSEEKARYETHENDITDPRYQEFVRPLVESVSQKLTPASCGLDFGAGTGPILASLFRKRGFQMEIYDPFFWPHSSTLQRQYDFVVASEVVEHFSNPHKEFQLLKELVKPNGILGLMTLMHGPEIKIESWYYLKDPTHVCAYSPQTFEWIVRAFTFSHLSISLPRMAMLTR